MTTYSKKPDFYTSQEGLEAATVLRLMVADKMYTTEPSFSADSVKYTDNLIPFVDKHLEYLKNHPSTSPAHYLSNLKLMTKIRK